MITYFDSNVILSLVKKDSHSLIAKKIWDASDKRVSSILLEAECHIVLRRFFSNSIHQNYQSKLEEGLQNLLSSIHLRIVDSKIISMIRSEKALSGCRSLDALHLATALYYKNQGPDDFFIATFDKEMAKTAQKFGLAVVKH